MLWLFLGDQIILYRLSHFYLKSHYSLFLQSFIMHKGIEQQQLSLPGTFSRTKVHTQGRPSQLKRLQKGRGMRGQAEQLKQH